MLLDPPVLHASDGGVSEPLRVYLVDDHTAFAERGVEPILTFIDFQFGARRTPGPYWHTARDDLAAVSRESLNSVGRLVVETVAGIEKRLLAPGD